MNKFKRITSFAALICFATLGSPIQGNTVYAAEKSSKIVSDVNLGNINKKAVNEGLKDSHNFGLKQNSKEDKEWMDKHMVKTTKVALNSLGKQRVKTEENEKAKANRNFSTVASSSKNNSLSASSNASLPNFVDNSVLPAFPTIGNQGRLGSCTTFASTYYQMTYTSNLSRGLDAKNDANNINKFSPKWTYNFCNGGENQGSNLAENYKVLTEMGAAKWNEFPYVGSVSPETNYKAWPTDASIYRDAMNYEIDESGVINIWDDSTKTPVASPDDSHLQAVKTMLANGSVLTFGTYYEALNFTQVKDDPSTSLDDAYAGQLIADWASDSTEGGHCMTIVGYDDDIWSDINNNGVVDPGEKGAFKIANSWGSDWGNNGFLWLSYDALNPVSSVANNPSSSSGRQNVFQGNNEVYWITVKPNSYSPKVIAQFTLNTANRSQSRVEISAVNEKGTTDKTIYCPYGFQSSFFANCSFDGTANSDDATFVLDLTKLVDSNSIQDFKHNKWNVKISDGITDGTKLTVKDFKFIDNATSEAYEAPISTPVVLDGSSTSFCMGSGFDNVAVPSNLHSDSQGMTSVHLSWSPSITSGVTGYAIYNSGNKVGTTTSTDFNVANLRPGTTGEFSVRAYNDKGEYSLPTDRIKVSALKDTELPTVPTGFSISKTDKSVTLTWKPSTDNYKVENYFIFRDKWVMGAHGVPIGTTTNPTYTDTSVEPGGTYKYYVEAYDGSNVSEESEIITVQIPQQNKVTVYYKSSAGRNNIHYCVNKAWTEVPGKSMSDSILYPGYKEHTIDIGDNTNTEVCFNLNGNNWDNNNSKNYTLGAGRWMINGDTHTVTKLDAFKATAPTNLVATNTTDTSVRLTWTESKSTGSSVIGGYGIYRDGVLVGIATSGTSFMDNVVSPKNNQYNYYVRALDSSYNPISDMSNSIIVGTKTSNIVTIYYKNGYTTPYIHYCPDGGSWTAVPGVKMPAAEMAGYNKISIDLGTATQMKFCFNDGNGKWDNNRGNNYTLSVGTYTFIPGSNGAPGIFITSAPNSQSQGKLSYNTSIKTPNYLKAA